MKWVLKKIIIVLIYLAALASGLIAVVSEAITYAVSDPHQYQPVIKETLFYCAVSIALSFLFISKIT